jgi:hypothetical protein
MTSASGPSGDSYDLHAQNRNLRDGVWLLTVIVLALVTLFVVTEYERNDLLCYERQDR